MTAPDTNEVQAIAAEAYIAQDGSRFVSRFDHCGVYRAGVDRPMASQGLLPGGTIAGLTLARDNWLRMRRPGASG
ncbi:MAG: hypothetical protein OEM67_12310 [Thermoleophilia bacterium]|nr:hypothetical protein [Thermoleophilia bacterium]